MSNSALDKQTGGSHYKDQKIQPVEYIHANGIGFMEGSAIKYLSRHKKKNGRQDVEKALHFCELILDLEYPNPPNKEDPLSVKPLKIDASTEKGWLIMNISEKMMQAESCTLEYLRKELAHIHMKEEIHRGKTSEFFRTESGHHFQD